MLPPRSVPMPHSDPPPPISAPSPPEDPPAVRWGSSGLTVNPKIGLVVSQLQGNEEHVSGEVDCNLIKMYCDCTKLFLSLQGSTECQLLNFQKASFHVFIYI